MKFQDSEGKYFKHKNCMDVFVRVRTVVMDSGDKAILWLSWMIQGTESYWLTREDKDRVFIKADQYENWEPYEPKGKLY